jgi:hypothetical protein
MNEQILYTFATVASALAGFSGIAAMMVRQDISSMSPTEQRYLWFLVGDSFLVILFSLLPVVLNLSGLGLDGVWGVSAALFGTWLWLATAIAVRGEFKDGQAGRYRSISFVTPLLNLLSVASVVAGALLWLSAFDWVIPRGQGIYLVALLLLLCIAALEFMYFVGRATLGQKQSRARGMGGDQP